MLLGQTVMAPTDGMTLYGPWLPRQGNTFVATLQVIYTSGGAFTMIVDVQTKNAEDNDTSPTSLGTMSGTAVGLTQKKFGGCKELVRYKYSVTGTSAAQWLHVRMNPPIWAPN